MAHEYILGLSAYYHDSAACLLRDGEIVAAAQEERFSRKKGDERFPRLAVDYCLFELDLHRIEVAIRPENAASLRVVEKLGFTRIGMAPNYLHIDGDWRDHLLFSVTAEEVPEGLLRRYQERYGAPNP